MNFVKSAWKLLVAIKDGLVLLFLILFFTLIYLGLKAARTIEQLPGSGALYLQLDGPIVEQPSAADGLSRIAGNGSPPQYRLRDVVNAIEQSAQDSSIKAVVLDLDGFGGGGQVAMQRVGAALDKVRAANKPVLVHAALYDDDRYLLAAHASEVWLSPLGMVGVTGPGGSSLYYKGLIEKAAANIHVYRVGTYKSAVEPYTLEKASPEAKAADEALVKAVWEVWLADVARARPKAKIARYLSDPVGLMRAAGGDTGKAAVEAGLVDKLGDEIAFGKRIVNLAGAEPDGGPGDFSAIPFQAYARRHPADIGQVGIITVAGEIVDGDVGPGTAGGYTIANLIRDAMTDDTIKALVLRVDSPGGSVSASEEIRAALVEARTRGLPVVVSMANVAASGGYWVSTAADVIYAEPATVTGSIGVFGIVPSFEGTLAKLGVTSDSVQATPFSGEPDILGGISPEFDALAQMSVENIYRRFTGLVAAARKMNVQRVDEIAQGRVWDGGTARQLNLVDRFGGIEDAVADAAKRAGLSGSDAQPRYFDPAPDRISQLLGMFGGDEAEQARARAQAPRDWLGLAAQRQRQWSTQIIADLRALVDGPAVRADCLECRAYVPPHPAAKTSQSQRWLRQLATLIGF